VDDRLVVALGEVPDEVAGAVEQVKHERPREEELESRLGGDGKGGGGGGQRGGLEVPTRQRGSEVGDGEQVQGRRHAATRDTGPHRRGEPSLLEVVDSEVGGYRPLHALAGEDLLLFFRCDFCGRGATDEKGGSVSLGLF
jgi:hypothetical protein